jgi:hypothetical protein
MTSSKMLQGNVFPEIGVARNDVITVRHTSNILSNGWDTHEKGAPFKITALKARYSPQSLGSNRMAPPSRTANTNKSVIIRE